MTEADLTAMAEMNNAEARDGYVPQGRSRGPEQEKEQVWQDLQQVPL